MLRRRLAAGAGAQAGADRASRTRSLFVPAGGTRYIAFNTTIKPFDNINVRKAIIAGVGPQRPAPDARRRGRSGDIANGWIPPGIPGFEEAGGLKQNTDLDFLAKPEGDPALAKKYMLAAKKEDPSLPIDADGKCDRQREAPDRRHERRPRQEDRRGLPGPDGEARASS